MSEPNKEVTRQTYHFTLSKGEREPKPRPMAHVNWPPNKPPGGELPEPLKAPKPEQNS